MIKNIKLEYFSVIVFPLLGWLFSDYLPKDWQNFYIPFKINIAILIFCFATIIILLIKLLNFNKKIASLNNEIQLLTKFSKVENYDLLKDYQNIYYCMVHKSVVTQTGDWGNHKDCYWCGECKRWYESHLDNNNNSENDSMFPFSN